MLDKRQAGADHSGGSRGHPSRPAALRLVNGPEASARIQATTRSSTAQPDLSLQTQLIAAWQMEQMG